MTTNNSEKQRMTTDNFENSEKSLLVYRVPKVMLVNASALQLYG